LEEFTPSVQSLLLPLVLMGLFKMRCSVAASLLLLGASSTSAFVSRSVISCKFDVTEMIHLNSIFSTCQRCSHFHIAIVQQKML
jgi:hypothetical protein